MSVETNLNQNITDLENDESFQEILHEQLEKRNPEIVSNDSLPKFSPKTIRDNKINEIHEIAKEFKELGIVMRKNTIESQLQSIIEKNFQELHEEIIDLKEDCNKKFDRFYTGSEVPIVVRELIKYLRIYEINKEKKVFLSEKNPKYAGNQKLLNEDLMKYNDEMYQTYKDPNNENKYLYNLFTYRTDKLNSEFHPSLDEMDINEIKEAVEDLIDGSIEELENHKLVVFYRKYEKIRDESN